MRGQRKAAAYTGTRNLYRLMVPAVKSLITNSDVDDIYLFIEDDEFPKSYGMPEDIVHIINCSKQTYFPPDGPNMKSKFTYMALMRAAFYKEFPKLDTILSLDVDTIVNENISDIWDLPLGDEYYFAASKEPGASIMWSDKTGTDFISTNIGVCLQNLRKFREDGKGDEIIEMLNTMKSDFVDQEAFNYLCQGAIYELPPEYNSNYFTKECERPKIVHYAGIKKWDDKQLVEKYAKSPWSEVLKYRKWRYGK